MIKLGRSREAKRMVPRNCEEDAERITTCHQWRPQQAVPVVMEVIEVLDVLDVLVVGVFPLSAAREKHLRCNSS